MLYKRDRYVLTFTHSGVNLVSGTDHLIKNRQRLRFDADNFCVIFCTDISCLDQASMLYVSAFVLPWHRVSTLLGFTYNLNIVSPLIYAN